MTSCMIASVYAILFWVVGDAVHESHLQVMVERDMGLYLLSQLAIRGPCLAGRAAATPPPLL